LRELEFFLLDDLVAIPLALPYERSDAPLHHLGCVCGTCFGIAESIQSGVSSECFRRIMTDLEVLP
jgi:hypothetical protein